jgi:probable rRNA maturation factor
MIVNLQRKLKLDAKSFEPFLEQAIAALPEANGGDAAVAFVSDRRMTELNRFFRGKDSTTDVLSFQHEPDEFEGGTPGFLGDIVISVEQANRQADENGLTLENEIKQLILHGLLHLCGFDHETDQGQMNRREIALRDTLGI